jgi:hypothetical protein
MNFFEDRLQTALEKLRGLLTPWVFFGSGLVAVTLLAGVVLSLFAFRPAAVPRGQPTVMLNVIPAPTMTPILPTPAPPATPTATEGVPPSPQPGVIAIGSYVAVSGTGTDGLRLRADPGLSGEIRFLGIEAEVFQVQDGPRESDGYTWWFLAAPFDEDRRGWAVSNYLTTTTNP